MDPGGEVVTGLGLGGVGARGRRRGGLAGTEDGAQDSAVQIERGLGGGAAHGTVDGPGGPRWWWRPRGDVASSDWPRAVRGGRAANGYTPSGRDEVACTKKAVGAAAARWEKG